MPGAYLLLQVSGKRELSTWAVVAVATYIFVMLIRAARSQEHRRKLENQPHTFADSALLLFSGLVVVGLLLIPILLDPLHAVRYSRLTGYAILVIVGGGLTYVFNRKNTRLRKK